MKNNIFLSYRRTDSRHVAGRLANDLSTAFGGSRVFRDVDDISPGLDFADVLREALDSCAVMLVLIGPKWLDARDDEGRRRLDKPDDWTRLEVATALDRDIRVVPVLVEDTQLPSASSLPDDLKPLVRRQAVSLSDQRWRADVRTLTESLQKIPGLDHDPEHDPVVPVASPPKREPVAVWRKIVPAIIAAAIAGVALIKFWPATDPEMQVAAKPNFGELPLTVQLDATTKGPISTVQWKLGNESKDGKAVTWQLQEAGQHTFTATAYGRNGAELLSKKLNIQAGRPNVQISVQPQSGEAPLEVSFIADMDSSAGTGQWSINGSAVSENLSFKRALQAGEYTASFAASNKVGETLREATITVTEPLFPRPGVPYHVINSASGLALEMMDDGNSAGNYATIKMNRLNPTKWAQQWYFVPTTNDAYVIVDRNSRYRSKANVKKMQVINMPNEGRKGAEKKPGFQLHTWEAYVPFNDNLLNVPDSRATFRVNDVGGDLYTIQSVGSGQLFQPSERTGMLVQQPDAGVSLQRWGLRPAE